MFKICICAACVVGIGLAVPAGVSAQSTGSAEPASVRRPYRGIFGGGGDPSTPQSLIFTSSVYGAYDDNIIAGLTNRRTRDPFLQRSGPYQGIEAGLEYSFEKKAERYSIATAVGAMGRYTHSNDSASTTPYGHAELQIDWHVTRSTLLTSQQSTGYASRYNFGGMPGADEVAGQDIVFMTQPDFDLFGLRALRSMSSILVTQQLGGKNASLTGGYIYRTVDMLDDAEPDSRFHDYQTQAGLLRFNYSKPVTPHAELQIGYGVRISDRRSGTGEPRVMQTVNAGVNYSRALSFSRRTSLSFNTGSVILNSERYEDGTSNSRPRFRLVGNASLNREMGRTWTAQLSYARAVRARDGFEQMYFTDAASANLNGLITRRLSVTSAASWALSTLDRPGHNGRRARSVTTQLTYGLNSVFGLFARYVYYKYRYDEDISLDPRLPGALDRQGIRVGVTTSVPLIR